VLWSLRNTLDAATQETPFFLVHGAEAMLPVEITHEAPRIAAYDETTSNEALQDDIDALDKARYVALARATQYQQSLRNYHSTRVRPCSFIVGDLILRIKQDSHGKSESPWLGPYIVTEVIPGGAYRLQDKKIGKDEGNPWNAEQLQRFYAEETSPSKIFIDIHKTLSYDPLNLEHKATGRVSLVNSMICICISAFSARGLRTLSHYDSSKNNIEIMLSCFLTSYHRVIYIVSLTIRYTKIG
jgi:hypothetical protein